MPTASPSLQWLADAFERHLASLASRGHRKSGSCFPFEGSNEATVMRIADRIFTGLGFHTWPESRVYEDKRQLADLWAESPNGGDAHLIEGKIIWDGMDLRLNRKRFFDGRELLGDFDRLTKTELAAQKIIVWVGFSGSAQIVNADEISGTLRLGDAVAAVAAEFPGANQQGQICVNFENYSDCPEWKFGHVLCWTVK